MVSVVLKKKIESISLRLPQVISDKILLFLFYLFSSTIISKTIAFICAFQYLDIGLKYFHTGSKKIFKEWIKKSI